MSSTGILTHRDRGHATATLPALALALGEYLAVEAGRLLSVGERPSKLNHFRGVCCPVT